MSFGGTAARRHELVQFGSSPSKRPESRSPVALPLVLRPSDGVVEESNASRLPSVPMWAETADGSREGSSHRRRPRTDSGARDGLRRGASASDRALALRAFQRPASSRRAPTRPSSGCTGSRLSRAIAVRSAASAHLLQGSCPDAGGELAPVIGPRPLCVAPAAICRGSAGALGTPEERPQARMERGLLRGYTGCAIALS